MRACSTHARVVEIDDGQWRVMILLCGVVWCARVFAYVYPYRQETASPLPLPLAAQACRPPRRAGPSTFLVAQGW